MAYAIKRISDDCYIDIYWVKHGYLMTKSILPIHFSDYEEASDKLVDAVRFGSDYYSINDYEIVVV